MPSTTGASSIADSASFSGSRRKTSPTFSPGSVPPSKKTRPLNTVQVCEPQAPRRARPGPSGPCPGGIPIILAHLPPEEIEGLWPWLRPCLHLRKEREDPCLHCGVRSVHAGTFISVPDFCEPRPTQAESLRYLCESILELIVECDKFDGNTIRLSDP